MYSLFVTQGHDIDLSACVYHSCSSFETALQNISDLYYYKSHEASPISAYQVDDYLDSSYNLQSSNSAFQKTNQWNDLYNTSFCDNKFIEVGSSGSFGVLSHATQNFVPVTGRDYCFSGTMGLLYSPLLWDPHHLDPTGQVLTHDISVLANSAAGGGGSAWSQPFDFTLTVTTPTNDPNALVKIYCGITGYGVQVDSTAVELSRDEYSFPLLLAIDWSVEDQEASPTATMNFWINGTKQYSATYNSTGYMQWDSGNVANSWYHQWGAQRSAVAFPWMVENRILTQEEHTALDVARMRNSLDYTNNPVSCPLSYQCNAYQAAALGKNPLGYWALDDAYSGPLQTYENLIGADNLNETGNVVERVPYSNYVDDPDFCDPYGVYISPIGVGINATPDRPDFSTIYYNTNGSGNWLSCAYTLALLYAGDHPSGTSMFSLYPTYYTGAATFDFAYYIMFRHNASAWGDVKSSVDTGGWATVSGPAHDSLQLVTMGINIDIADIGGGTYKFVCNSDVWVGGSKVYTDAGSTSNALPAYYFKDGEQELRSGAQAFIGHLALYDYKFADADHEALHDAFARTFNV